MRPAYAIAGAVAIGLLATSLYLRQQDAAAPGATLPVVTRAAEPPPASTATAAEPKVRYPIGAKVAAPRSTTPFDLQTALADLFGSKTVQSIFRLDDFPRRLVATVDNMGRDHAATALWPVNPASGKFTVEERDGAVFIGADNELRYAPYVLPLETADLRQVVAIYTRIYPALQHAYEDLGYPKGYFNDRLVEVIDQLIATPETDAPLQVRLPSIEGSFNVCAFWRVDALVRIGQLERARDLFESLLARRNHVGLLSEDMSPASGELWGNFPQTYSMVGIINGAVGLSARWEDTV